MSEKSAPSLKSRNFKWLLALAATDALIIVALTFPHGLSNEDLFRLVVGRGTIATIMPVLVLLLINILPPNLKARLVYWNGHLPGFQAFSKHAHDDPRIDIANLKRSVGDFPTDQREQNTKWYGLYRLVENEASVQDSHKLSLMYRDMAAMTVPLIPLVPFGLYLSAATEETQWLAASIFFVQYLLTSFSARWNGIALVRNVLAVYSSQPTKRTPTRATKVRSTKTKKSTKDKQ